MKTKDLRTILDFLDTSWSIKEKLLTYSYGRLEQEFQGINLDLTKKNYYFLLDYFKITPGKKHTYLWITDGTEDKYVADDYLIQEPFYKGRSHGIANTTGYKWYNDGIKNIYVKEGADTTGLFEGPISSSTKGYKRYTDGKTNISIKTDSEIPEGFYPGISSIEYKEVAAKKKKITYNNGISEIKLLSTEVPPEGFIEGKLTSTQKINARNKYYEELGYIAVGDLTTQQKSAYQYYRDNTNELIDIIYKPGVYTYISKEYLPMFNTYAETNHSKGVSNKEIEVLNYIKDIYSGEIRTHVKNILKDADNKYYDLDIYLPELKVAIEFNGTYWHSIENIDKNYHFNKSKLCETLGIRLIHIYEYEWDNYETQQIIKAILRAACKKVSTIYARKCIIKEITNKDVKDFNNKYHLQGHRNAQVTYGLFYNNELVHLMSFSRTKYNRNLQTDNSWEIIRGCIKADVVVVGGVEKLFKHFITQVHPIEVFSYCDFNKFTGNSYLNCGMHFIGYTGPDMKWVLKDNSVVNRQPSKHKELKEIAKSQIYGSGSKKYLWKKYSKT